MSERVIVRAPYFVLIEYRVLRHVGEGTFSEVLKAESVKTKQKVAIKCMKSHFDRIEQVRPMTFA